MTVIEINRNQKHIYINCIAFLFNSIRTTNSRSREVLNRPKARVTAGFLSFRLGNTSSSDRSAKPTVRWMREIGASGETSGGSLYVEKREL